MFGHGGSCQFTRPGGERCRARARAGRDFCFHHDPASAAERREARAAGGRATGRVLAVLPAAEPDETLKTTADVVRLLGQTINQTRRGELDPKVANAVGYLASALLRAIMPDETARQIDELREQIEALKGERRDGDHGGGAGCPQTDGAGGGTADGGAAGGSDEALVSPREEPPATNGLPQRG
jgi:hypothetical protein